jgi:hypothetical protein
MRTRSLSVPLAALAALLTGVLLAGCAGDAGDDQQSPSPSTPAAPSPSLPPPALPTLPSVPPPVSPPPTSRTGEVTLTGEVVEGVEAGCLLLETTAGQYLLFGEPVEQLRGGAAVTVRGTVHPEMASTCQQGTPFEVTEVVR